MPWRVYESRGQIGRSMRILMWHNSMRWLCRGNRLTGVAVAVLSLVSAGLAGCGGSPSGISSVVSPAAQKDAQAGPTTQDAPSQTPAPAPSELPSPTASPTATVAPTADVPPTPVATPPPPTAVLTTSGFVLEHPDVPPEIEARILEGRYMPINVFPRDQDSDQEPFVNRISCDEPASIAYLQGIENQAISSKESDLDSANLVSIGRHSWLVSWKAGFLQVGYPKVIDACMVEILTGDGGRTVWWFPSLHGEPYLLVRESVDGIAWTTPVRLSVPIEVPPLGIYGGEVFSPPLVLTSNGDTLLVGTQNAETAVVSSTNDLIEWQESEVRFHRPDSLHPRLATSVGLENIALGPNG